MHKIIIQLCETTERLCADDLCDNIGLVLVHLPSGAMSLHHLACIPSHPCLVSSVNPWVTLIVQGDLCNNIGLVLVHLPSGAISLHHTLAIPILSPALCWPSYIPLLRIVCTGHIRGSSVCNSAHYYCPCLMHHCRYSSTVHSL